LPPLHTTGGPCRLGPWLIHRALAQTNVFGALRVTQKFLPQLRKDGGRVVMVSSLLGKFSVANFGE
jgi:NAD(P)-dependent dehydrogenase (short-subunit alcohol dehydrogenase family)